MPSKEILQEIDKLEKKGIQEIVLLGQNVNSYGKDTGDISFAALIEKISDMKFIKRIKFVTSHPKDFSDELIEQVAFNPKVNKHVHLPLQSASDKILSAMNRQYSYDNYVRIIEKLRQKHPLISISSDILLGFPGESGEDYELTRQAVEALLFDKLFVFMYSPRSGTKSYDLTETVAPEEKSARLAEIVALQHQISAERLKRFIGLESTVFVENKSKKSEHFFFGLNEYDIRTVYDGSQSDIGKLIKVANKSIKGHTLVANPLP